MRWKFYPGCLKFYMAESFFGIAECALLPDDAFVCYNNVINVEQGLKKSAG